MFVSKLRTAIGGLLAGLLVASLAPTGTAAPVPAERIKAEKELAVVGTKLQGTWRGNAGCQGELTLRSDGTYEWRWRGPDGDTDAGAWAVRWDGLSPALILKCKTSCVPKRAGQTVEMKLVQLDDAGIAFDCSDAGAPLSFSPAKKEP